jgi:hypothetical protein
MGLHLLNDIFKKLTDHWKGQGIEIVPGHDYQINAIEQELQIKLPDDFRAYFRVLNGMPSHYPNTMDEEGFLFYPIERIEVLKNTGIILFAEYMHKSWWYGVKPGEMKDAYEIGMIPDENQFIPISNSLSDFIQFYLQDDSVLYG